MLREVRVAGGCCYTISHPNKHSQNKRALKRETSLDFPPAHRIGRTNQSRVRSTDNGFDHINRNPPVLIRTPKLTRFEPAQYWGGGPPGNSVVLNPFFWLSLACVLW